MNSQHKVVTGVNDYLTICLLLLMTDFSCSQSRIDKFLTSLGLWKLMYKYLHKMLGTCTPVNVHVEVETNYFFHELIKVFLNEDSKYLSKLPRRPT